MAPSLPGTASRRSVTRGSSSSSTPSVKREGSVKREARSSRASSVKKQDSDSEGHESSPVPTKSRSRKASDRTGGHSVGEESQEQNGGDEGSDDDESKKDDNDEESGANDSGGEENTDEPPADLEEIEGEIDEAGETKITKNGELLGGRQYRCRSFKLPDRGDRIYMLSMDPARVLGFRDSYLFFLRNPQLVRVNTTVEERQWMIENGMLMANFKSKLIAVVTARSIFKSFGARIIKGGRSRVDDYYESRAGENEAVDEFEGDGASRAGEDLASGSHQSSSEVIAGQSWGSKRKLMRDDSARVITDLNWQYESALAVRALNTRLKDLRKDNPKFLDPHTNVEQIPTLLQPNKCEVQVVSWTAAEISDQLRQPSTAFIGPDEQSSAAHTGVATATRAILSAPHSIGPLVDTSVKVNIRAGVPPPPMIHDPSIWAVIPEDIRQALEDAENTTGIFEDYGNEDLTKYPISILSGQYQASYPIHQSRFQQPYRITLPQ
ncbi:hypothetical protein BX616_005354, partial [Lobosporangium transversale]